MNWLEGIWFKDEKFEQIEGKIHEEASKIPCGRCKRNWKITNSTVIQCDKGMCAKSMHVRCAVECKWIYNWYKMAEDLLIETDD